ncbi:MAG TPA: asparagine synthase-related protein, partial [Trebonia sp.]
GPAEVVWRSPDARAALLRWGPGHGGTASAGAGSWYGASGGDGAGAPDGAGYGSSARYGGAVASHAGTIWAGAPGDGPSAVCARTSVTRVDPVYLAEVPGAVIVADRATWAAWTVSRLGDHDPLQLCALLGPGFPLGSVTPFRGVAAVPGSTALHLLNGSLTRQRATTAFDGAAADEAVRAVSGLAHGGSGDRGHLARERPNPGPGGPVRAGSSLRGAREVAEALVAAVAPLRDAGGPVELSLTGGKDSRLIAAALVKAGVPVIAKTHGFDDHPDVVVAAEIARRLGLEHVVRTPAAPGQRVDVLGRIRATVLVADGMLSAFENVGRPDPAASPALTAGGHGGELLRGGYAETAGRRGAPSGLRRAVAPARRAARSAELLRRLTTKHLGLVRRGPAAAYVASLAPWTGPLARHPLHALDDFYLVNRAGRWSAAARQAYLLRERLTQPLFDDRVVLAARTVPLGDRISGALSAAVLAELSPALTDVPLAGKPDPALAPFDWRRQYGETISTFLRGYILDLGLTGGLFDVVSQSAVEAQLTPPHADRATVWALATAACLVSGDYRKARETPTKLTVT